MTNKIQVSWKFDDGAIIVIGGDTVEEFRSNCKETGLYERVRGYMSQIANGVAQNNPPAQSTSEHKTTDGEGYTAQLPDDAVMEITYKGKSFYGEISPFPGTKYPVRVWPEVIEAEGFDPQEGEINVGGRAVFFVKNEKGYPQKVTAFK